MKIIYLISFLLINSTLLSQAKKDSTSFEYLCENKYKVDFEISDEYIKYSHHRAFIPTYTVWSCMPFYFSEALVSKINKLIQHPELYELKNKHKITNPQEILRLGYFFLYQYKNNARSLLDCFYEIDALYSLAKAHVEYHFQFPNWIDDTKPFLQVEQAAHPLVPNAIGNDLTLSSNKNFLFLTLQYLLWFLVY